MPESLNCYRCGVSLDSLSPPLSRQDQCPACFVYLHCCRMCDYFDPSVAEQCREDDAEEVKDKECANFCDYFRPTVGAHDPRYAGAEAQARSQLDALFGNEQQRDGDKDPADRNDDDADAEAEDLFR
jgi:hypothetical protein